jgi:glycosyltransferase involved in cell wall biosynthesis
MRIAQVVPAGVPPYSGVPIVIVQLSLHLARRGHQVEVWLLQPWSSEEVELHGTALTAAGVALVTAPSGRRRFQALGKRPIEIAHLHSVFAPPNGRLARRLRVPYVVSPHGGYAPASLARSALRKALYRRLVEGRLVRRAALRVALTDAEATDLRMFGAPDPIVIIPNGVPPAPRDVDRTAFRRELGLDATRRLLVFVGRLDVFHKGLDVLVRGLASAVGWHAALVGSDFRGGHAELRKLADSLGVGPRLSLVGSRHGQALHEAFAAADCFALTSRWEGLPLSLLEALAHGVPAVVSPAVDRLVGVVAAGAGWSAGPDELGGLLRRLHCLDGWAWESRAVAARALAARYDWTSVTRRYEAAYLRILERTPR